MEPFEFQVMLDQQHLDTAIDVKMEVLFQRLVDFYTLIKNVEMEWKIEKVYCSPSCMKIEAQAQNKRSNTGSLKRKFAIVSIVSVSDNQTLNVVSNTYCYSSDVVNLIQRFRCTMPSEICRTNRKWRRRAKKKKNGE